MMILKTKCLDLLDEYNHGKNRSAKMTRQFMETWDDQQCALWLTNHFDYDIQNDRRMEPEEVEAINLEKINNMNFTDVIVGFSGGKDSVATTVRVCEIFGDLPVTVHIAFSDTGNESKMTYDYVKLISENLYKNYGVSIQWLQPERDFMDLVRHKGMFPVNSRRFCTEHLKVIPMRNFYSKLVGDGKRILMCQGMRRSESFARAHIPQLEFDADWGSWQYRPLCYVKSLHDIFESAFKIVTMEEVLQIYRNNAPKDPVLYQWGLNRIISFGYPANPHYGLGFTRLGCAPCFMSSKYNVRLTSLFLGSSISQIRQVEREVGATFFFRTKVPERFHDMVVVGKDGRRWSVPSIDAVAAWSKTKHYSRGSEPEEDLLANIPRFSTREENLLNIGSEHDLNGTKAPNCGLNVGLCE